MLKCIVSIEMVVINASIILQIILPVIGMIILLFSLFFDTRVIHILKTNDYSIRKFIGVGILLLGFLLGYALLVLVNLNFIELNIDPLTIVGLVYFFGAIFTWVALDSTRTILHSILGEKISDEEANKMFREFTGVDEKLDLTRKFEFECENCARNIIYSVADVVRANAAMLERGISVETVFGVKSFILRPQHRCRNGRREFTIIHDNELRVRSQEKSRLLFKL